MSIIKKFKLTVQKFKLTVHMKIKVIIFTSILVMFVFLAAYAQGSVENLQDLINVKGRDGEYQMKNRGYTWIRTLKSGGSAYSYWRENQSDRCVSVCTSQGRYATIDYTPDSDCHGDGQGDGLAGINEQKAEFLSVCGVSVRGKIYRYRCGVMDVYQGKKKSKQS